MDNLFGVLTPELHNSFLYLVGACLVGLAYLARYQRPKCDECQHCKARTKQEETEARERAHDYEHKGAAWRQGDPDRFRCADKMCLRNPRQPGA
jgi:hypothetical protein